jgi:hypothetical protein
MSLQASACPKVCLGERAKQTFGDLRTERLLRRLTPPRHDTEGRGSASAAPIGAIIL